MRYFYILGQQSEPERFWKIQEIRENQIEEYKEKDGYIKTLTQEQALTDGLLRKHFTVKQIEESYEQER